MRVKKVLAKDMREALKMVKETLGPDAMILNSRQTSEGVEVMAALEDGAVGQKFTEKVIQKSTEPVRKVSTITDPALDALRDELSVLRHVVQEELGHLAFQDTSNKHPVQSLVFERLIRVQIEKELAKELSFSIKERNSLTKAISEAMDSIFYRLNEITKPVSERINCFVFSGLSGAGKTSSIAAYALSYRLKYPERKITVINFDNEKVAAHEPLKTYAKILEADYIVCENKSELKKLTQNPDTLVLIDCSLQNRAILDEISNQTNVLPVLVVSAISDFSAQIKTASFLEGKQMALCVITHTDEASNLGVVSSILLKWKLVPWFILKNESTPYVKKAVFFDAKKWVDDLFKNEVTKEKEQILRKGVA